jgi:hypothetical protein
VFQPELRRALEQFGAAGFLIRLPARTLQAIRYGITRALLNLSSACRRADRHTANGRAGGIVETGTRIDGAVSAALLATISRRTALHD